MNKNDKIKKLIEENNKLKNTIENIIQKIDNLKQTKEEEENNLRDLFNEIVKYIKIKAYEDFVKEIKLYAWNYPYSVKKKEVIDVKNINQVLREMKNNVNRIVNCETANLNKTISASVKQIENIKRLKESGKFNSLPEDLKEIANLRLENPDATLEQLGSMLKNPIGKSSVSHRFKKLGTIRDGS